MKNISLIINFLGTRDYGKFPLVILQLFSYNWYDERPLEESPGIYGMNLKCFVCLSSFFRNNRSTCTLLQKEHSFFHTSVISCEINPI